MKNERFKDYLRFQYQRIIVSLYKRQLETLEDLRQEHKEFLNKIKDKILQEELNKIDYFNDQKYNLLRKRILDSGNEVIRDFEKNIENLDIGLKIKEKGDL